MEKKEIVNGIIALLNDFFGIAAENVTAESSLMEELGLNSFDMMMLLPEIESRFGVEFSAGVLRTMLTVGDAADYIEKHIGDKV